MLEKFTKAAARIFSDGNTSRNVDFPASLSAITKAHVTNVARLLLEKIFGVVVVNLSATNQS